MEIGWQCTLQNMQDYFLAHPVHVLLVAGALYSLRQLGLTCRPIITLLLCYAFCHSQL